MSYLVKLVILNKYLEQKQGNGRRKRNSKERKKTAFEIAKENNERSLNRDISFISAVRFALSYDKNEVLVSFFEDLISYGKMIDNMDAEPYITMNNELKSTLQQKSEKIDELLSRLANDGVKASKYNGVSGMTFYVDPKTSDEVFTVNGIGTLEFDGIEIVPQDLDNMTLSKVVARKNDIEQQILEYGSEEELKLNLEQLKKKRFFINKRKRIMRDSEIYNIETKLSRIASLKKELSKLNAINEKFSLLPPSCIQDMKEFFVLYEEFKKIIKEKSKEQNSVFDTISAIYRYNPHRKVYTWSATFPTDNTKRNRCQRILELMEKDGKFSEERVAQLATSINDVIEKLDSRYYHKKIYMYSESKYFYATEKYLTDINDFFALVDSGESDLSNVQEVTSKTRK